MFFSIRQVCDACNEEIDRCDTKEGYGQFTVKVKPCLSCAKPAEDAKAALANLVRALDDEMDEGAIPGYEINEALDRAREFID